LKYQDESAYGRQKKGVIRFCSELLFSRLAPASESARILSKQLPLDSSVPCIRPAVSIDLPVSLGLRTATLNIADNSPGSPQQVQLSANVVKH